MQRFLVLFTAYLSVYLVSALALAEVCPPVADWADLNAKLAAGEIKTVEALICALPERFRKNYVLASDSRSLQRSTKLNPRAILFDPLNPTSLILSFGGDASLANFNNVEIIRAKDFAQGELEFIDVAFDPAGQSLAKVSLNPEKCANCHGTRISNSDRRLLFDANPSWPGFYGSGLAAKINVEKGLAERADFEKFKAHAKTHSRYQFLLDLDAKVPNQTDILGDASKVPMEGINKRFTIALAEFNRNRLVKIVMQTPYYQNYKFAILGALSCQIPVEDFLPESLRKWHSNESWLVDELKNISLNNIEEAVKHKIISRLDKANKELRVPDFLIREILEKVQAYPANEAAAKFALDTLIKQEDFAGLPFIISDWRYLFEGRRDPVSIVEWNIDVNIGFYRFNNNPQMNMDLPLMIGRLKNADSDLAQLSDCQVLKEKSLAALAAVAGEVVPDNPMSPGERDKNLLTGKSLVNFNCAHCHARANQDFAPRIDFHNKFIISGLGSRICSRMSLPMDHHGHMPKFFRFEKTQMAELFAYFQSLSAKFSCEVTDGYSAD